MKKKQNNQTMKITYLYHSGFVVELPDAVLIFDYFRGSLPQIAEDKQIFVFSSHRHYDHFKRKIFDWKKIYKHITYILSDDIPKKQYMEGAVFIGPDASYEEGDLQVRTLKSTDEGAAFLIRYKDRTIYHAGDLNWWHWEEESNAFNEMMKRNYQYEISKIEQESIDVAFIPVDARLGAQYYYGIDYFMRHTNTSHVFPMHFWGDYSVYDKLVRQPEAAGYIERVMHITGENEVFVLGK